MGKPLTTTLLYNVLTQSLFKHLTFALVPLVFIVLVPLAILYGFSSGQLYQMTTHKTVVYRDVLAQDEVPPLCLHPLHTSPSDGLPWSRVPFRSSSPDSTHLQRISAGVLFAWQCALGVCHCMGCYCTSLLSMFLRELGRESVADCPDQPDDFLLLHFSVWMVSVGGGGDGSDVVLQRPHFSGVILYFSVLLFPSRLV